MLGIIGSSRSCDGVGDSDAVKPALPRGLAEAVVYGDNIPCSCTLAAFAGKGLVYVCDVEGDHVCVGLMRPLGLKCACWAGLPVLLSGLKIHETGLGDSMDTVREPAEVDVWAETFECQLCASSIAARRRRTLTQITQTQPWRCCCVVSYHASAAAGRLCNNECYWHCQANLTTVHR